MRALDSERPALDLEQTARVLAAGERAATELKDALEELRQHARELIVAERPGPEGWWVEYDGLPKLQLTRTATKKEWDGKRAAAAVAAQCADEAVDRTTGEVMPLGVFANHVAQTIVECAGLTPSKGWRKETLRARGLDPDTFHTEQEGRQTVRWDR